MNKESAQATSLPEATATEAAVDPAAGLPDFPGEPSAARPAKPKRVRKPRVKATGQPKADPSRPILHLKSSADLRSVPAASDVPDTDVFELTGAPPDEPSRGGRPAPRQIEIPELQIPSAGPGDADLEQNGTSHETVETPQIAAPSADSSLAQLAQAERVDLNGHLADDNLAIKPEPGVVAEDAPARVVDSVAVDERPPAELASQQESTIRQTEAPSAPDSFDDPRFTYVPQWQREAVPSNQPEKAFVDRPPPAADLEPDLGVASDPDVKEQVPVVPAAPHSASFWRVTGHSLRTQLILIAAAPILVGTAIAFLVALLSPTLFAARSEIVVNVTSMDWSSAERFLATQLVVVKARSTLEPISQTTGIPLRDLEKDLRAELIGSSDVISIQYANSDAAIALNVVKAVTAQYLISLRDYEQVGNGRHRILMPATVLEDPVSLRPLSAALIGAVVGLAIGVLGIVLRTQMWRLT